MSCTCGSDNSYTRQVGPHLGEYCSNCDKWIRWISQPLDQYVWPLGSKHKGKLILAIAKNDRPYLEWAAFNLDTAPKLKLKAQEALDYVDQNM
jgi:hypothetical protein